MTRGLSDAARCWAPGIPWDSSTTELVKELEQLSYEERDLGVVSLEKFQGNLINIYKYLKGGCKEDRAGLFLLVSSDRIIANGHKLKQEMPYEHLEQFFTVRVIKH